MKGIKYLLLSLAICGFAWAGQENPILSAMQSELNRSMQNLRMEGQQTPYFISYRVTDRIEVTVEASLGAVTMSSQDRNRRLSVDLRVGSYELDNSGVKESTWSYDPDEWKYRNMQVPIDDDTIGLKHQLWLATDYNYKKAVEDYSKKSKEIALNPEEEEERPDDFSREDPEVYIGEEVTVSVDRQAWEEKLKRYSELFKQYKEIYISKVGFEARLKNSYFVSSEGSKIQDGELMFSIEVEAYTRSKDGMPLVDYRCFTSHDGNFDEDIIIKAITDMAEGLVALKKADECESYVGPVLIAAPVSGAFLEKTLVPLVAASKELWEHNGALKNNVGERILPSTISVYDDPLIDSYQGQTLSGHYRFDDEGIAAQKVNLITNGVLRNFLLSRSPVKGFDKSNGHGRSRVGIGNLIMESSTPLSFAQLKSRLISECRKQGKSYGLLITSAVPGGKKGIRRVYYSGGLTISTTEPSDNLLEPVAVYKVYTDGRQELLRGVEVLSSSPLATLDKIIAVGADHGVWNTSYPTGSIVAPSLLVSELEVRKATEGMRTLPILPPPGE